MTPVQPFVIARVVLADAHTTTGRTRHYVDGTLMARPHELRAVRYSDGEGFYLFYCDATGTEMSDTWHSTLEEAFSQAEFEFQVRPEEWTRLDHA